MKVLIVDDEPLARMRLTKMLGNVGISDVITADNGANAIDSVKKHHPHIVFLDIEMPVLSGIDAAPQIHQISPESKIIFCTAYDEFAIKAFDLSASDYLLKPVSVERLNQALEKVMPKQTDHISVQNGMDLITVEIEEVYCVTSVEKCTYLHCQYGVLIIDMSLLTFEKKYPQQLLRINRNALINKNELFGIHRDKIHVYAKLKNTDFQPQISRRNINLVKNILK